MAEKFNIFSNILAKVNEPVKTTYRPLVQQTTGVGTTAPLQVNKPVFQATMPQKQFIPKPVARIGTQAVGQEKDLIQSFLDDTTVNEQNRATVFKMLQDNVPKDIVEKAIVENTGYTGVKPQDQGFISGAYEKGKESFVGGIKRIGEAGVGIAEGKYTPMEGAMRGGAGALQTFFSPITGVVGETIQTGIEQIPQDIRTKIKQEATPTIEGVKQWYNSQSPEQKRRLDNIGVGVELLANFVGAKGIQKTTPIIKQAGIKTGKQVLKQGEKITTKSATIGKIIEQGGEKFRNTIAGLQDNEIQALKNTPTEEFETMLSQAKKAVGDDYAQTPYHEGAKKANESFKVLEKNLSDNQVKRVETIKNSGVSSIDTSTVRQDIVKDLENTFNVKGIKVENGKIKYTTTKGRASLLDEANPKDLEAIKLLESVSRSKTPLEMMDTIKKMQNLIYDSSILNRTSKDMYNLVKRSIGKLNQTFKEQVGGNYGKILEEMSGDIKLKYDLDKVFKAGLDEVGNRGELAMKRLAKGTTTSSDVRNLALKIKERTGIDLIKEARLRQLVMDLVGDTRGESLFGVVSRGKRGMIEYGITKAKEFTPFSKEKTAIARTKKLLPNNKKNANTSNNSNSTFNTTNKTTNGNTNTKTPTAIIGTNNKLLKAPTTPTKVNGQKKLINPPVTPKTPNKINNKGFIELNPKLPKNEGAIKNYKKDVLINLLKETRYTGKIPLREDIAKGFIDNVPLLERTKRIEEVKQFLKDKVLIQEETKKIIEKPLKILKKPKTEAEKYGMQHRPTKNGATGDDITKGGEILPKDFYETPQYYFNMKDKPYKESFDILKNIKGNPNAEVTIYRAGYKDKFNEGDWVTLSKTYAQEHMERQGSKGVYSMKVKAKDIQFAGDDINEFGYYPQSKPTILKPKKK